MLKAVIFDWDNTLIHTWAYIHKAVNITFAKYGHKEQGLDYLKMHGNGSLKDAFPKIFGDKWMEAREVYYNTYRELAQNGGIIPYDNAEKILQKLQSNSIPVLIISNKYGPELRKEVKQLKWEKYFANVVGSTDALEDKPSSMPVLLALSVTELEPTKDIWFVGDTDVDMNCAINSGCTPIFFGEDGYLPSYLKEQKLQKAKDHYALEQLINNVL